MTWPCHPLAWSPGKLCPQGLSALLALGTPYNQTLVFVRLHNPLRRASVLCLLGWIFKPLNLTEDINTWQRINLWIQGYCLSNAQLGGNIFVEDFLKERTFMPSSRSWADHQSWVPHQHHFDDLLASPNCLHRIAFLLAQITIGFHWAVLTSKMTGRPCIYFKHAEIQCSLRDIRKSLNFFFMFMKNFKHTENNRPQSHHEKFSFCYICLILEKERKCYKYSLMFPPTHSYFLEVTAILELVCIFPVHIFMLLVHVQVFTSNM